MISETDLKATISAGRLKPVYLLFGKDSFLIKHYTNQISKKTTGDAVDLNLFSMPEETRLEEIYDHFYQLSFTGDRICVTVPNFEFEGCSLETFKDLQKLVENPPDCNVLVLYYDVKEILRKKSNRFSKLAASVEKGGGVVCELNHKSENELVKMLCNGAAKRRVCLDKTTARYMITVCSSDLNILVNELEKLTAFVGIDGVVTKQTIDDVCVRTLETSVYDMSRHLLAGRLEQAFYLLHQLMAAGISPAEIHGLIASAYVDIFCVKAALDAGRNPESVSAALGYTPNRSFLLKNAARDASRLSQKQIDTIIYEIINSDAAVKNNVKIAGDGAKVALEVLMTKIMKTANGGKV